MEAFALLDEWPVGSVSAALVRGDGSVTMHGSPDRTFRLASVSKPLTAIATLVAVEEGILDLDEPAGPPGSTVRHLLAHASGLAPDQRRLLTEPGTRRIYSNAGFELVAELVATRADMDFGAYLHEAVFQPLGMTRARLEGSPAHGVVAALSDLVVVVQDLLRPDPQLLAKETRVQLAGSVFPEIPGVLPGFGPQVPNPWGLGVELRGHKDPHWTGSTNSPSTYGHFGRSGGFFWVDPRRDCALVALADRDFGPWSQECWPRFADAVLAEFS
ncbi:MAG: serine hydrolase [Actinomycetota bacterium]|nr:serine hydrolase [Actinomycetota bacterium]